VSARQAGTGRTHGQEVRAGLALALDEHPLLQQALDLLAERGVDLRAAHKRLGGRARGLQRGQHGGRRGGRGKHRRRLRGPLQVSHLGQQPRQARGGRQSGLRGIEGP
jgi:hypothetical protein